MSAEIMSLKEKKLSLDLQIVSCFVNNTVFLLTLYVLINVKLHSIWFVIVITHTCKYLIKQC